MGPLMRVVTVALVPFHKHCSSPIRSTRSVSQTQRRSRPSRPAPTCDVIGILTPDRSLVAFTACRRVGALSRLHLRQGGIFGLVRHPVYGGVILIGLGWSLADAPLGLVPTALLAVLFDLKARREEAWLIERFPEYAAYRARAPRRFVPWLY